MQIVKCESDCNFMAFNSIWRFRYSNLIFQISFSSSYLKYFYGSVWLFFFRKLFLWKWIVLFNHIEEQIRENSIRCSITNIMNTFHRFQWYTNWIHFGKVSLLQFVSILKFESAIHIFISNNVIEYIQTLIIIIINEIETITFLVINS